MKFRPNTAFPGIFALLLTLFIPVQPAVADLVNCTPSPGYTDCVRVTYSGSDQTFTVPAGFPAGVALVAEVWGAGGAGANYSTGFHTGGSGGGYSKTAIADVAPGDIFTVVVGQGGLRDNHTTYAYGGGGRVGNDTSTTARAGGGGGGFSGIFLDTLKTQPIVIAGGGGGASPGIDSSGFVGGGGGIGDGSPGGSNSGQPGTLLAGGLSAAATGCTIRPTAGEKWVGGDGAGGPGEPGGGGGGGFYGGGGGACQQPGTLQNGGGGGGSGFVDAGKAVVIAHGNGTSGNLDVAGLPPVVARTLPSSGGQYVSGIGASALSNTGKNGMVVFQWSTNTQPQFTCDATFYAVHNNMLKKLSHAKPIADRSPAWGMQWENIGTAGSAFIHGVAFNERDGLIYGIDQNQKLVRIGSDGSQIRLDTVGDTLPALAFDSGTYLGNGVMLFGAESTAGSFKYTIDTKTILPTVTALSNTSVKSKVQDFSLVGDTIYTIGTATNRLVAIDPATGLHSAGVPVAGLTAARYPATFSLGGALYVMHEALHSLIKIENFSDPVATAVGLSGNVSASYFDGANCASYAATEVFPPLLPPELDPDVPQGQFATALVINPLDNDTVGTAVSGTAGATNSLDVASVRICAPATTEAACLAGTGLLTVVTVAGEGTYRVTTATGVVTFTPLATFFGTATPIKYTVKDQNNQFSVSTITPVVAAPAESVANPDTTVGPLNTVQNLTFSQTNDPVPTGVTWTLASLRLCTAEQALVAVETRDCTIANNVFVRPGPAGQGQYRTTTTTGQISFTPDTGFVGTAEPVMYQRTDSVGRKYWSTYTPTVAGLPSLTPDSSSDAFGVIQSKNVLTNDNAHFSTTLNQSSLRLCDGHILQAQCTGTNILIIDVGRIQVTTTGTIQFTPCTGRNTPYSGGWCTKGFIGSHVTRYRVADALGQLSNTTYTLNTTGPEISALSETKSVLPSNNVTFTGITSTPGLATGLGLTVCLVSTGTTCGTATRTITGQGTFTLNATTGVVTFAALATATPGTSHAITYRITDTAGQIETATLTVTIPMPPSLLDDSPVGAGGATQTISPLANDLPGDATAPLNPGTLALCPDLSSAPATCAATSVVVEGKGEYALQQNGTILFTPVEGFDGVVDPIKYVVQDSLGQFGAAQISTTVLPPPAPITVTAAASAPYSGTVTFNPLANDSVAIPATGYETFGTATLNTASLRLCGPTETADNCSLTSVTTAAGVYTLNQETGEISFTANQGFVGQDNAAPNYSVCISVTGTWAPATPAETCSIGGISMTIQNAPAPTTVADTGIGPTNAELVIDVAANDSVAAGLSKISNSVRLCGAETDPMLCNLTTLVLDEGTFVVDENTGLIQFTPADGFSGAVPTVNYSISDSSASRSTGSLSLSIQPPPAIQSLTSTDAERVTQSQTLTIPQGGSIALLDAGSNPVTELVVSGGRYSLNSANGVIQFVPNADFFGVAPAASIQVVDVFGQSVISTYTATVIEDPPPPAPILKADAFAGIENLNVTGDVLSNDAIPENATISLVSDVSSGSLVLEADGSFTYTPTNGFSGTVSFDYQVCHPAPDQNVCSTETATIVISAPIAPKAVADSITGTESTVISGNVATNDTFQSGSSFSATTQPANGTLELLADGSFNYTPNADFVGTDSFNYQICLPAPHDATCATSTATLTVEAAAATTTTQPVGGAVGVAAPAAANPATSIGLPITLSMDPLIDASTTKCLVEAINNSCSQEVTIPGVGTFTIQASGAVVFAPIWGFVGEAQVPMREMRNGLVVSEQPIVVLVEEPVSNQIKSIEQASLAEFVPVIPVGATTCLVKDAHADCQQVIRLAGFGSWSLSSSMVITFIPEAGFIGESIVWLRVSVGSSIEFQRYTAIVTAEGPQIPSIDSETAHPTVLADTGESFGAGSLSLLAFLMMGLGSAMIWARRPRPQQD